MLQTPLYTAASKGDVAVVEMLVKAGADVNKESHVSISMRSIGYYVF